MSFLPAKKVAVDRLLSKWLKTITYKKDGTVDGNKTMLGLWRGMSPTEAECLHLKVVCDPPMTLIEIAKRMNYSKATISYYLKSALMVARLNQEKGD